MGRHCFLHIGTEKTGTTSLQRRLARNRDALSEQGVHYCSSLGDVAHRALSVYAMDLANADDAFLAWGIGDAAAHAAFRDRLAADFKAEVATHPEPENWIISTEHLHSRLFREEQVEEVRRFLEPYFDEITVFLHLRPQIDVAVSLASTHARVGNQVSAASFESVSPKAPYYNYRALCDRWESVFGADRLHCIALNRSPDMADTLLPAAGARLPSENGVERANAALDVRVIAMINTVASSGRDTRIGVPMLDALPVRERLSIGRAKAQEIQARFEPENAALIESRPDLEPGDLTPDWGTYPIESNLHLLEEPCSFSLELAELVALYEAALDRQAKKG